MKVKITKVMKQQIERVGGDWKDEGGGYFSLKAFGFAPLAYVALPKGHPDIGKDYDDLSPNVNGGLTFGDGNVYGWDYGHAFNRSTPEADIKSALKYFRSRSKAKKS
jgi:hypothetical protein